MKNVTPPPANMMMSATRAPKEGASPMSIRDPPNVIIPTPTATIHALITLLTSPS
jgi:hypothetical protein